MRKATIRIAAAMVCATALIAAGLSIAASHIEVHVYQDGSAVAGAAVEIMTSNGVVSGSTDANGVLTTEINSERFRVRVNGVADGRGFSISDSPVTINIP